MTTLRNTLIRFQEEQDANRKRIALENFEEQLREAQATYDTLIYYGLPGRLDKDKALVYLDEFIVRHMQRFNDWNWEWTWGVVAPHGGSAQIRHAKDAKGLDELLLAIQEAERAPDPKSQGNLRNPYEVRIKSVGTDTGSEEAIANLLAQGFQIQFASAYVDNSGDLSSPVMMMILVRNTD